MSNKKAVLSQRKLRDAAVNFDMYQILQQHRTISLPQQGFPYTSATIQNAEITHSMLISRP